MFTYTGLITRVIDGDTVEAVVDLGFQIAHTIRVRLLNVNAPELFSGNLRHLGVQAQHYLEQLVLNKQVLIHTHKDRMTFNRYLATILIDDQNINEQMDAYCQTLQ